MKTIVFAALLLCSVVAWSQPNPADYPVTVHVTRSWLRDAGGDNLVRYQMLDVIIGGKKFELESGPVNNLIVLGNYKARVTKDAHKTPYRSQQTYQILFPDNKTESFIVVGESE